MIRISQINRKNQYLNENLQTYNSFIRSKGHLTRNKMVLSFCGFVKYSFFHPKIFISFFFNFLRNFALVKDF